MGDALRRRWSRTVVGVLLACGACGTGRVERWTEDLDFLAREIANTHPEPFRFRSREAFEQDTRDLKSDLPQLESESIYCRMRSIVAALGDAHTDVRWSTMNNRVLPIRLLWLEDGFYVTAARPENADLIGCRLKAIGDVPAETARDRLATLIPHENRWAILARFPEEAVITGQLHYLGLSASSDRATLEFERRGGGSVRREVASVHYHDASKGLQSAFSGAGDSLALSYRNHEQAYWFTCVDERKTLYLQYNRCEETRPMAEFADEIWRTVDARRIERIVIDLRKNRGGSSPLFRPILKGIQARPELNRLGRVWVLIGPETFSSGLMNAVELRSGTAAILVGLPTGGKPNSPGEVKYCELPRSKARLNCSTKAFQEVEGDPATLEPDIVLGVSAKDYLAGRDPALDYALTRDEQAVADLGDRVEARQGEFQRVNAARFATWPQAPLDCDSDAILGTWEASVKENGIDKRVAYRFERRADGQVLGFVDSVDEGVVDVHIEKGSFRAGRLEFTISRVGLTFEGTLAEGEAVLNGHISQGNRVTSLSLRRRAG